jgi:hypothetical protein
MTRVKTHMEDGRWEAGVVVDYGTHFCISLEAVGRWTWVTKEDAATPEEALRIAHAEPEQTTPYGDSPTGALRLLLAESDLGEGALMGARTEPDLMVPGCWLVVLRDGRAFLVYVAAHPLAPDFEQVGPEPDVDMDGGRYHRQPREGRDA